MAGDNVDGDGDGVVNELSIGDMTALASYMAAQARPTTKLEVNSLGLLNPAPTSSEIEQINRGRERFGQIGCATCHVPSMTLNARTFSEPSQNANFRDVTFPVGPECGRPRCHRQEPGAVRHHARPTGDRVVLPNTNGDLLGSFRRSGWYGGREHVQRSAAPHGQRSGRTDRARSAPAPTPSSPAGWWSGSTAPYLHDGRATMLTEAILYHTGSSETTTFGGRTVQTPNFTPGRTSRTCPRQISRRYWRSSTT